MKKLLALCCIGVTLGFANESCVDGENGCLYGWNRTGDHDLNWSYWSYLDPINEYGARGYMMDEDNPLWSGSTFNWANGGRIRMMSKGADGLGDILAKIDTTQHAPSTATGNSFKVYDSGESSDYAASWWMWYDGRPLSERNITDADTDRMSFYLKTEGMAPLSTPDDIDTWGYHIGTYLCWYGEGTAYGTGDGCPYEGPGNQHYYHYLGINPGAWLHVELDQHPQHLRGDEVVGNNPSYILSGKNYFEHLFQFYMEIRHHQEQETSMNLDEMRFYSTKNSAEPNQNEESITSVWVGYWPQNDYWEIGFADSSYSEHNDSTQSTFEIRYATEPITNANYDSATLIEPMYYSGPEHTDGRVGAIRRASSYGIGVWTRFTLPDALESSHNTIYFAIKDISVAGAGAGTQWPWTKLDGHDAPTDNIRTIDYDLRPSTTVETTPTNGVPMLYLLTL